jgi:hypothetical protein
VTWAPKPPKHDWRAYLTKEEAQLVAGIEAELAALEEALARRAELAARLSPIRNRAIQRAKWDKGETVWQRQRGIKPAPR